MATMSDATSAPKSVDESSSTQGFFSSLPSLWNLQEAYNAYSGRREALGLPNPGTVEQIAREVQQVSLSNQVFTGLRADITKVFCYQPLFQLSHAFAVGPPGTQPGQGLPPYTLSAIYGTDNTFLQGNIDNEGNLSTRANYRWSNFWISKTMAQFDPDSGYGFQFNNEFTGPDFTAAIDAMNPSILTGGLTGIFIGSYLQSITSRLALGGQAVWQRQSLQEGPVSAVTMCARYRGLDWAASAQTNPRGGWSATYQRKVAEKLDAGVELKISPGEMSMLGPGPYEGLAIFSAKYDFRMSTFRAQIDSAGKLGCLLDKRVAPSVTVTFAGEMDHIKNQAKIGLAVSLEAMPEELLEAQERGEVKQAKVPW